MGKRGRRTDRQATMHVAGRDLREGMFVSGHGPIVGTPRYRKTRIPAPPDQEPVVVTRVAFTLLSGRTIVCDAGRVFAVHAKEKTSG